MASRKEEGEWGCHFCDAMCKVVNKTLLSVTDREGVGQKSPNLRDVIYGCSLDPFRLI